MTPFVDHYEAVRENLPEVLCARERRDAAMAQFCELGLPGRHQETWRHTDMAAALRNFSPVLQQSVLQQSVLPGERPFAGIDCHLVTFANGCLLQEQSSPLGKIDGMVLDSVLRGPPQDFRPANALECLTTALARDGALIHVDAGVRVKRPIQLLFLFSDSSLGMTRNRVILEAGARATVLECHMGRGFSFAGTMLDIHLGAGARLHHVRLQAEGEEAIHMSLPQVRLEEKAQYDFWLVAQGAKLSRLQGSIGLCGSGARAQFATVMRLMDKRHCDATLQVSHEATECESLVNTRSVLEGDARGVFQVRTTVWRGAQRTKARQILKTLLLSAGARMHAQPALAVFADDVQCAHGATSGGFDEDVLFYLRTRGIVLEKAKELLMQAFLEEVLRSIPGEKIRRCAKTFLGCQ